MKKSLLIVVSLALLAAMLVGCSGSKAPSLLTVTGKVAKTMDLTEADFTAHATELQYHDPWVGDTGGSDVMEKGILLSDLIAMVKPTSDVTTVALICTDGKEYDVKLADAQQYKIMLVHWVAGKVLDQKTGGPVKVAYSADATSYTSDAWAWWVVKVEFK